MPITSVSHGHAGKDRSTTYRSWQSMKSRCCNENDPYYFRYGGRGITVCQRWLDSFENFLEDMGLRPPGRTLDRIDNNGNYCKENCRWATAKEQACNTRNNTTLTFSGKTMILTEWIEHLKLDPEVVYSRLKRKWSYEQALFTPVRDSEIPIEFRGETFNLAQWAEKLSIPRPTLAQRLRNGWSVERAFTTRPTQQLKNRGKLIEHNGKAQTLSQWAKELGIPVGTLQARMYRYNMPLDRALTP